VYSALESLKCEILPVDIITSSAAAFWTLGPTGPVLGLSAIVHLSFALPTASLQICSEGAFQNQGADALQCPRTWKPQQRVVYNNPCVKDRWVKRPGNILKLRVGLKIYIAEIDTEQVQLRKGITSRCQSLNGHRKVKMNPAISWDAQRCHIAYSLGTICDTVQPQV
jgi:hypothetical protein